jgi:hypothetical protein
MVMLPEDILRRWVNYHLQQHKQQGGSSSTVKAITNFGSDLKVRKFAEFSLL